MDNRTVFKPTKNISIVSPTFCDILCLVCIFVAPTEWVWLAVMLAMICVNVDKSKSIITWEDDSGQ